MAEEHAGVGIGASHLFFFSLFSECHKNLEWGGGVTGIFSRWRPGMGYIPVPRQL